LALLAVCLCANLAWAQLQSGSVTGLVTDPTNAVVPGAKIVLLDEEKGFTFNGESDGAGRYLLRAIPPSTYKITITAEGFQTQTRTGVTVNVNQSATVDFALALRTSAEAVTITGEAPLLATEDASTGQVLNRQFIGALPVLGRDPMALTYLTPGVVGVSNGSVKTGTAGNDLSSSGGRGWTADVLLDGISTTQYEQNGGLVVVQYLPSPDAIEEFKVQTSNFSAEFGFTGATVVNVLMRSGTNEFHGTAYEYLRNSKLDSNTFFNNAAGRALPALRRNNFGVTVGGPIKRNKTFFFVDYDGFRQRSMRSVNAGVPSAAERQGNFGELCGLKGGVFDSAGKCSAATGQLWDPYTGSYSASAGGAVRTAYIPFNNLATYVSPGNPNLNGTGYQLAAKPGNLIDPVALKMMQYFPLPNYNVSTSAYQYYNNWIGAGTDNRGNNMGDVKIDHRFSDATLLSGKFSTQRPYHTNWNAYGNAADTISVGFDDNKAYLGGLNLNHTFSSTLLATASYGFNRWHEYLPGAMGDFPGVNPITTLGLPNYMGVSGTVVFPALVAGSPYTTTSAGISVGTQPSTRITQGTDQQQGLATVSWIRGSHELKFGGESRWHRISFFMPAASGGQFSFAYTGSSQTPSSSTGGDPMASMLMGIGMSNNGNYQVASAYTTTNWQWGGFVQDNWKVRRNLTINLGMRYDLTLPRTERYNRANWLDPTVVSPLKVPGMSTLYGGEIFANATHPQIYEPDYSNWQPRVGFAWRPTSKTVIRGGYGIFFAASRVSANGVGGPGHAGTTQTTTWITSMNNDGATPWGRLSDPFPGTGPMLPPGNSKGIWNDIGYAANGPYRFLNQTPYEQTWNLDIQRELPGQILFDAAYVGKKGTHNYFGGDTNFNHLPQYVENYSPSQVSSTLLTYVNNPFYGYITDPLSTLSKSTVQAYQLLLPFPQFTTFGGDSPPESNSIYNGLQVRVEKRFSAGLQVLATYAFSKFLDDSSVSANSWNTGSSSLQDPNNRRLERSVSIYDITHVLQFSHVYQLPFGHGKKFGGNWNPVVNGILGGWEVNGIWTFDSGRPLSPSLTGGFNLPTYGAQRPNLVGTPARNTGSNWMTQYFADPTVFARPTQYALGNAPRTLPWVRTPGARNTNLALSKSFALTKVREGMRLQFLAQTLNAFNHPQFAGPSMSYGSAAFGTVTSQANTPRDVELALKLNY
jgi:hypothetical protein